jgi:predicted ribosome quality control (RQC) complex YloA/Tae2 family protein
MNLRGKEILIVPSFEADAKEIEIPLNPKLTLYENAQKYFDKTKHIKETENLRRTKFISVKNKINVIDNFLNLLQKTDSSKEIGHILKSMKKELNINLDENTKDSPASKFRTFDLGEGCFLYVGRNAANNDELTMKFAKPNDIWLHARGSGGSHAVLRLTGKETKPPKQILKKAAEITAYYSQARKAKYIPVCYTFKKYVHKPKGSNPGSVVLSKEEVVMAEPKLPEETT